MRRGARGDSATRVEVTRWPASWFFSTPYRSATRPSEGRGRTVEHRTLGRLDPAHWLARAREMRQLADQAADDSAKSMMLRIAADYEKLAERAEKRRTEPSA